MSFYLWYAAACAVAVAGNVYDVTETVAGIKKGVAVEEFTWLVGQTCTKAARYFLRDFIVASPCFVLPALAAHFHNLPIAYGFLAAPVAAGLKHLHGGLAWKKLGA